MPSFKPKENKKLPSCHKTNITLDSKHNEKMAEFEKIEMEAEENDAESTGKP